MGNWHIITAGPSAGKSSVLRELSSRGYRIRPEAARIVLDQKISEGVNIEQYREKPEFNQDVIEKDINIISNTDSSKTVFFDRTIFDNIAYRQMFGLDIPEYVYDYVDEFTYVFMLELLEYEDDPVRVEDPDEAQLIHQKLREVYEEQLGFNIIDVSVMTVENRVDKIEEIATSPPPVIH